MCHVQFEDAIGYSKLRRKKSTIHKAQHIAIITGSIPPFAKHLKGQLCKSKASLLLFIVIFSVPHH